MWSEVVNGVDLLALVAAFGALLQAGWLFAFHTETGSAAAAAQMHRRADGYFCIVLGLLTLTTAAALLARSADISGLPWDRLGPVLPQVLGQTHFGRVWWLRAAVIVAIWIAWWALRALRRRRELVWFGVVCLLVQAWCWSVTAHPGDHGSFTLAVWVAVLHIFSAGLWGGSVLAVAVVAAPVGSHLEALGADAVLGFVHRLSAISAVGLTLVVASGIFNAWSQLAHFSDFWTSAYGQVLDVKLAFVLMLVALGTGNRFWRVPRVVRAYRTSSSSTSQASLKLQHRALRRLLAAVVWEAVVLLAIVAVVSVLVQSMPPADAQTMLH
ncbi:MAG: CopD family protein [Caldimonas sp.]